MKEQKERRRAAYLLAKLGDVGYVALSQQVWKGRIRHVYLDQMYDSEVERALDTLEIAYERWRSIKWQCER